MTMTGQWNHHTIVEVKDEGSAVGFMYEDRTWGWIPRPPIPVKPGDRISVYKFTPYGYSVRFVIGEMEVPTFYALERARRIFQ